MKKFELQIFSIITFWNTTWKTSEQLLKLHVHFFCPENAIIVIFRLWECPYMLNYLLWGNNNLPQDKTDNTLFVSQESIYSQFSCNTSFSNSFFQRTWLFVMEICVNISLVNISCHCEQSDFVTNNQSINLSS